MSHHDHEHEHSHAYTHVHTHTHGEDHDHTHDHDHRHAHTHAHTNEHNHGHEHEHQYDHDHPAAGSTMTLAEKATKLLDHWIRHNKDHAATYRQWADRLNRENMADAAALLVEAADMCARINDRFSEAAKKIRK